MLISEIRRAESLRSKAFPKMGTKLFLLSLLDTSTSQSQQHNNLKEYQIVFPNSKMMRQLKSQHGHLI
jgi:hypothetical protein